jgi:hypothetical protein
MGTLMGHNNMPCGRPTPGQPIGDPEVGRPYSVFGGFSYYWVMINDIIFLTLSP